ncbi:MAG: hypothetical protein ACT4NY_10230 [Pseudonocardiales bacterium]
MPRLFQLEEEYLRVITVAELAWVDSVVEDLRAGRLAWSPEWLASIAAMFSPTIDDESHERGQRT